MNVENTNIWLNETMTGITEAKNMRKLKHRGNLKFEFRTDIEILKRILPEVSNLGKGNLN